MFQGIQCVVHGADHIKANKICQDAAGVCERERFAAAVVSDGHGGSKYIRSDIGSKYAVDAAIETVCAYMEDFDSFTAAIEKNADYILNRMECYFITKWNEKIEIYNDNHELTDSERKILDKIREKDGKNVDWHSYYGCTVLIAVIAEGYSFGMLVGDGTFAVVFEDGTVKIPIDDPYSVANMTSSICDKQCIDKFQHYYEKKQPISLTVSSDGLCKSFGSEESLKDYHLRLSYMMNTEQFKSSLEKNLQNFTQKGSGDDISVAAVFAPDILNEKKPLLLKSIEEKKKIEQMRKEAEEKRIAEVKRQMELARQEEERRRQEEERRRQEEEQRRAEAARRQEEARRRAEERRRQAEARRRPAVDVMPFLKPGYAARDQAVKKEPDQREWEMENLLKVQQEQNRRERELKEKEIQLQKQQAELERAQLQFQKEQENTPALTDSLNSIRQRALEGAAFVVEKIGAGAQNMEEIISQKLEERADIIAQESADMEETDK